MSWSELGDWWLEELASDPAYDQVVTPLLFEVMPVSTGGRYLDLGAGEGRVAAELARLGGFPTAFDLNVRLLEAAPVPAVAGTLPDLPFADDSFDHAYATLVLEHLDDVKGLFREVARVVLAGGSLAVVMNHPIWTAPGSTPVEDGYGEVLWRPGEYFGSGSTTVAAGEGEVTFYHRSLADLLQSAAEAGWSLRQMVERPHHDLTSQSGIPRLLACRWLLLR